MSYIKDLFEYENMDQGFYYDVIPVFKGVQGTDNKIDGKFEFVMKVRHNMVSDVRLLCFYIKEAYSLSSLIQGVLIHIDIFKKKAEDVLPSRIPINELSFGNRSIVVAETYFFYSEVAPNESDIALLNNFFSDKTYSVKIRSKDYMEDQIKRKKYYAFLSHDSSDKDLIARPIATRLNQLFCYVWFDEHVLNVGDNMRDSINKGIKEAGKCIVVITKNFIKNFRWAKEEFDSIFSREMVTGEQILLPIWHGVTVEDVYNYHPALASTFALVWPSKENKTAEEYNTETHRIIERLYNVLTKPDTTFLNSSGQTE